jgi:DNA (cytosine-5)-methyltransferase 1
LSNRRIALADVFCGAGGFSAGFERAGFTPIFAIDNDPDSIETYNDNFDHPVEAEEDVAVEEDAAGYDFHGIDARVLIGGPPCQPYSQLGKSDDVDNRTGLTATFMRAVREIAPEMFLIENVPGYLRSQQATHVARVAGALGYQTTAALIDAKDHGVPQSRVRAFIMGSRRGMPFFPAATVERTNVELAIGDLPGRPDGRNWHVSRAYHPTSRKRFREVPPGGNRFDLPMDLRPPCWTNGHRGSTDVFGRLRWNRISVTIRTEFIKPEKGRYLHPSCHRALTPREGARLQSFPDSFRFLGSMTSVVRQIGNAVPPRLAYRLALAVRQHLDGDVFGKRETGEQRRSQMVRTIPVAVSPPAGYDIALRCGRLASQ